ncbi:hypothetical protein BH10ACT3_BH10ACT3_09840 [soil metagenome]
MTIAPPDRPGSDSPGSDAASEESVSRPVVRAALRQRKALRRRRRATILQSVLTVLFVVALCALAFVGWRSALKITGGRDLEITDPAAPGYVAEVKPTTVDMIAITNADGSLSTMLLVIPGPDGTTSTVVPVSAGLVFWEFEDAVPESAADLWASGGIDVVRLRMGVDTTFAPTDAVTVPGTVIEQLATEVGPITVNLADNVIVPNDAGGSMVKYPSGPLTLQPSQIMEFLSVRGAGEAELNRALRLSKVWDALLAGVKAKGGGVDLPGGSSDDLALFSDIVDDLNASEVSVQLLPTNEVPLDVSPAFSIDRIDQRAMTTWVPEYVPFPTSAYPGQRATVDLLNGTTNPDAIKTIAPKVVGAGGEISLTGNAESFDIATSRVEYADKDAKPQAEAIAAALGLTATRSTDGLGDVDVTVVVGKDLVP